MKTLFLIFLFTSLSYTQSQLLLLMDDVPQNVYAIDLNGSNEYAQKITPSNVDLSGKTHSIIVWVKTPSIIDGGNRTMVSTDANPIRGWTFLLVSDESWGYNYDNGNGWSVAKGGETSADTWRLVIATCFDLTGGVSDYTVYVDGIGQTTLNQNNTSSGASKLTIGQDGYSQGWYYPGQLGQMQIVSGYALTQSEITALYNAGGVLNASYGGGTVVAWYKWEGTTDAEMLKDWSASGNNLTGTNVTTADQVLIGATYK